jgi:lipid A 3-O-deacylase
MQKYDNLFGFSILWCMLVIVFNFHGSGSAFKYDNRTNPIGYVVLNKVFLFVFIVLCISTPAYADENSPSYLSFSHENDNLGGGTDRHYTSGARATWFNAKTDVPKFIDDIAESIPTFDINENTGTFYTVGQNLYTPSDIKVATQQEGDRPWAAFLYGSIGLATMTESSDGGSAHVDELEFTLGIVGPEALGEQTQKFVHKNISKSPEPQGWDNQLDFEPGFIVSWQRRIPKAFEYDAKYLNARIEPNFTVALGTIRTYAGAGATLILGSSGNIDTPPRVRPAMPGTGVFYTEENELNWQVFAGIDARVVGRDIFLDGNTFQDSYSVDKKILVGDASAGISFTYDSHRISYTINTRSKEFDGQEEESVFGSLTYTQRF